MASELLFWHSPIAAWAVAAEVVLVAVAGPARTSACLLARSALADLLVHLEAGIVDVGSAVQIAVVVQHELVRQFTVQRLHVVVCAVATA